MRLLLRLLVFAAVLSGSAKAQFPSPTFAQITVTGPTGSLMNGPIAFGGPDSFNGGGALLGTFTGPTLLTSVLPTLQNTTVSSLAGIASPQPGMLAFATDCLNGAQSAPGSGCPYFYNGTAWVGLPSPSSMTITIGGQGIFLGGATLNQGNGPKIQLAAGSFTVGNALAFDANGNAIDSGVPPSGGSGGAGTVTSAPQNSVSFYTNAGTTNVIGGLSIVNSAVLVTSSGGVPSESTTLPSALTIPSPTISNGTNTGTTTAVTLNMSGVLTTAASTTGAAGFNVPQGVAPASPANGNIWGTSAGMFGRFGGATQGPFIGLTSLSASSPLAYNNSTGAFTCTTCATTTNGGALTATSPMAISAGGVISLGTTIGAAEFFADSTVAVHNDTYPLPLDTWPWATGTIDSVTYYTGGTSTPSFAIALQINGTNVTSCNSITVNSGTRNSTTCTGANTITSGQHATLVISGTSGSPSSSLVQVAYHHSNP